MELGNRAEGSATGNITAAVTGDLWYPHVYMSAQNPWDLAGINAFGRWHYGPWFNPPVPECVNGEPGGMHRGRARSERVLSADCDGLPDPLAPPLGAADEAGRSESLHAGRGFHGHPVVNGTAYPYLEVEPKAYRFRVLNAANDRFFNLQLYVAADKTTADHARHHRHPCCATGPPRRTVRELHRGQDGPGQRGAGEPVCGLGRAASPIRRPRDRTGS